MTDCTDAIARIDWDMYFVRRNRELRGHYFRRVQGGARVIYRHPNRVPSEEDLAPEASSNLTSVLYFS